MAKDEQVRRRILTAAAEVFAENGYSGTKIDMIARRAGVSTHKVKRLTGRRSDLFAEVMAEKATSQAAERVAAAAADPDAEPPFAVLLEAVAEIFAAPERSWNPLELEALAQAHHHKDVRNLEASRIQQRWVNMKEVTQQARAVGALDPTVNADAFVHFALALSVGLAVVDPVVKQQPSQEQWNALMARIGSAMAPHTFSLEPSTGPRKEWRLRIDVPNRAGALASLIRVLSTLQLYVVATTVLAVTDDYRTIDLAVTLPQDVSADTLLSAAMSAGTNGYVTTGTPEDAQDLPTRVLDGATELMINPGSAPIAAAMLVEADRFEVTDATQGEDDSARVLRLQWTLDRHVVLHRDWAPFAKVEKTRASALLRLATAISSMRGDSNASGWVAPVKGGGTVWIRLARSEDADAISAMHDRSSEESRYRRYLQAGNARSDLHLRWLSGGHRGATLVVMSETGDIVGLGNVFPDGPQDAHTAEIAMLIEDDYQGLGIGTRLLRHMLDLADHLGFEEIVGTVLAGNTPMLHLLEAAGLNWTRSTEEGFVTMRAPLYSG